MNIFILTAITMIAFAANSVLARLALLDGTIDPASYTLVRIAAGAAMLFWLAHRAASTSQSQHEPRLKGTWKAAIALFAYAVTLSFAYISLDTGVGALILFACVQATMIGWAIIKGDRPLPAEWVGLIVAFGAFVWLVSPGLEAPDPFGTFLMALSGIAWGIYSLYGRGASNPLAMTAGNFVYATPIAIAAMIPFLGAVSITPFGFVLAVLSGAITSGLGYALWYRALRTLTSTQGAIVQLTVPVIAALGGIVFAGEPLTDRFVIASVLILGGVALAITAKARRA